MKISTLNQFQKYSQGENTITNNVLLMLASLYDVSPTYYEEYLNALVDENDLVSVIPLFRQQSNNKGNGFIDAHITTKQTSIIVETKINTLESIPKLVKYSDSFRENELSILFHLSTLRYEDHEVKKIKEELEGRAVGKKVEFYSITYEDMVQQLNEMQKEYPYDARIERIAVHFEDYCRSMNLLQTNQHWLRAMACGESFDLNIKHQFYFDQAQRGYSQFKYFGVYSNKSVRYIGTIENTVVADWDPNGGLNVISETSPLTPAQIKRLTSAIEESVSLGWKIANGHRFFLLRDMEATDFRKVSPGGIFRVRYFDLEKVLEKKVPSSVKDIANRLKECAWE